MYSYEDRIRDRPDHLGVFHAGQSSSAWANNVLASFKISLALSSSLFSRSSSFKRCRSDVLMPSRAPESIS